MTYPLVTPGLKEGGNTEGENLAEENLKCIAAEYYVGQMQRDQDNQTGTELGKYICRPSLPSLLPPSCLSLPLS